MKVNRDLFYKIASDLPEERLESVIALIKDLNLLELPQGNQEWSYVVNRLVKGLTSDRSSARLGFSLCLTEVLNLALVKKPECLQNIDMYLNLIVEGVEQVDDKKIKKGKDERSILFGKLFGLQILLSEPVFTKIFLHNDANSINFKFIDTFLDMLIDLAKRKNWIQEPTLFTIFQLVEKLTPSIDSNFIQLLLSKFDDNNLTMTCEGLAIYLFLWKNDFNLTNLDIQFNNLHWKNNNPFAKGNLPSLMNVLKNASVETNDSTNSSSKVNTNWSPRLHFVWDILLYSLFNTIHEPALKKSKKNNKSKSKISQKDYIEFPEFWQSIVDESFFNDKSSSERKYIGFNILIKVLPLIPKKEIDFLFTKNLMRCTINQSNDAKRHLHKISQKLLITLLNVCAENPNKVVPIINNLLFSEFGSMNFDKLTKTKTINKLLSIEGSNLLELFKCFTDKLVDGNHKVSQEDQEQDLDKNMIRFLLDSCLHVVRNHKNNLKDHTQSIILEPLLLPIIKNSFFCKYHDESINELYHEKLYSILSELSIVPTNDSHSWQYYTVTTILDLETNKNVKLNLQLDEQLSNQKQAAIDILNKIAKNSDVASRGLESLLTMSILQLFMGDMDSMDTIAELCNFYNENESMSLVGITEILLGFFAQKKSVLTKTSLLVWEQFISKVSKNELNLLLDVLTTRENKQGFAQLFEGADEFEIVDEENENKNPDEEDEDDFEDEDLMNSDSSSDDDSESESDSNSESDSSRISSSDGDNTKTIDKEATSALVKALNLPENIIDENGDVKFDELDELSDDEEAEESMDDEQMMALDDQLSQIFKHRKDALSNVTTGHKRKLEVKDSRESVIAFKHKILDMLTIYIKYLEKLDSSDEKESDKLNNVILFFEPIITCIQTTLDRSLAEKSAKLLKTKIIKIKIPELNDDDQVWAILEKVHNEFLLTTKPGQHNNVYFSICSNISIYLSKLLVEKNDDKQETYDKIIDIYANTVKQWLTQGKVGVTPFIDFINWLSSKRQL